MNTRLVRLVPLAGVVYALLEFASNPMIGNVPRSDAPVAKVRAFYLAHHAHVGLGGWLSAWGAVFLAVFGAALWARIRGGGLHPILAGAALIGTAVAFAGELASATTYYILGDIGGKHTLSGAALQAWNVSGSAFGFVRGGGILILLLAAAAAGLAGLAIPRWLAWTALPLAILQLTPLPIGFIAGMVFLLWAAVAGVYMLLQPADTASATTQRAAAAPQVGSAHTAG